MSVAVSPQALDLALPWSPDLAQEEAFKRNLRRFLIPLLLLFFIIPWLPTMDKEYIEPDSDLKKTQIILKPVVIETPVPEPPKPKATPRPKPKPKPTAAPPPKKEVEKPVSAPVKKAPVQKKKDVAEAQGLAGLSDQLGALRNMNLKTLQNKNVTESKGGSVRSSSKSTLGENVNRKSDGIDMQDLQMSDDAVQLAMHKSTKMDGFVSSGGSSDGVETEGFYSDIKGQRSNEDIRRILESGKARAYMYYQRSLRDNPSILGTLLFECVILPNGKVQDLKIVTSELNDPGLEQQILETIRQLNFGSKDVAPKKLRYKFAFLPS